MLLQYNLGELTNHHNGYFQSLTQRPIIQYITPLLGKLLIRTKKNWISNIQPNFLCLILTSNSLSLKYQIFTPSGCKDIGTKKLLFVAKNQVILPWHLFLVELILRMKQGPSLFIIYTLPLRLPA